MSEKVRKAHLVMLIGIAAVSTAAILVKLSTAPSSIIAFYRMFFTVVIISVPTIVLYRKDFLTLTKKDVLYSMLSGTFLAFHFITWFESLKYTSVASSVVLVTLQPLFAMLGIYLFFKEKVSRLGILGAMIALSGSFVIGWGDFQIGGQALYGDILALLGAVLVTGYWLLGQNLRRKLSVLPYTFLVYGSSAVVLLFYNLLLNIDFFNYSAYNWKLFIALAIFPTILGHTVFNWAIKYVNAATISVAILAEPVGASILAYIVLGEVISLTQIIGGTIIFIGIITYLKSNK